MTLKLERVFVDRPERMFWSFLALHLFAWTLVPATVQPNLPLDVIEELAWGREWQWGYYKHPPLQAWLLELTVQATGKAAWSAFLLSQLSIVVCFWAVWRLAREIVDPPGALLSVLLLEGVYYFNYTSPEFNPNVLQLPLWALVGLASFRALRHDRLADWGRLGLWAGLSMLAKYSSAVLLAPIGVFLLAHPKARHHLMKPGPYAAVLVGLVVLAPHLFWLWTHDFPTFSYALKRAGGVDNVLDHLLFPLRFAIVQGQALLPLGLLLLCLIGIKPGRQRAPSTLSGFDRAFLLVLALGPFATTLLISAVFGFKLRSMWGTPMWCFIGLIAVAFLRPRLEARALRRFLAAWAGIFVLALSAFAGVMLAEPYVIAKGKRGHFPGAALATAITERWHAATGRPLEFVIGRTWLAGNVSFYSVDRPSVYIDGDPRRSPWIDEGTLVRRGGVLVWYAARAGAAVPAAFANRFPDAVVQPPLSLPWQTGAALPPVEIGWAILEPAGPANEASAGNRL